MKKDERLPMLTELVDEVSSDSPNLQKVKVMMDALNIPYSEDPVELLNNVLVAIHKPVRSGDANV